MMIIVLRNLMIKLPHPLKRRKDLIPSLVPADALVEDAGQTLLGDGLDDHLARHGVGLEVLVDEFGLAAGDWGGGLALHDREGDAGDVVCSEVDAGAVEESGLEEVSCAWNVGFFSAVFF